MRNETAKRKQIYILARAAGFALEFGFVIALPLVGLGFLGKWLDGRMGTGHWVIVGILAALAVSSLVIGSQISKLRKE